MEHQSNGMDPMDLWLQSSYSAIVDTFKDREYMEKAAFFLKAFESAFSLIPEAEKGSYYELDGDYYRPILSKGYDMDVLSSLAFTKENLFEGFKVQDSNVVEVFEFINDKRDDSKFTEDEINAFKALGTYEAFTSLYAPINIEGETIGLLCFERFDGKNYSISSKFILKIYAELISSFYQQIVRRERERKRYQEIISAMVSAIEVKDKYTKGHAQRVKDLSVGLATYMNLPEDKIKMIETAAVLHDIGKIGIHSKILLKPSKLTLDEYKEIKQHPTHAKTILKNIGDFSHVVEIAYMHHEYYNGKGYPRGLKGDEILLEAAIICVCDVFDAITTDRSYREARSEEEACGIIEAERGEQFHPLVVDAFLEWRRGQVRH